MVPLEVRIPLRSEFRFAHEPVGGGATGGRFVGRKAELDALIQRILFSEGGSFLVTGYRGVGKTSFVAQVISGLQAAVPRAAHVLGDTEIVDVHLTIARPLLTAELMHHIIRRLHARLDERGLLDRLDEDLRERLTLAFQRTSTNMSRKLAESTASSLGLSDAAIPLPFVSSLKLGLSRARNHSRETSMQYVAYDDKAAEHDVIDIARRLTRGYPRTRRRWLSRLARGPRTEPRVKLKVVFVFDELDKLDDTPKPGDRPYLDDLLHSLKNLFTTSGISFVFVAGKDLQERWLEDLGRGDSVYESVFCYDKYLPCMWADVDDMCDGVVLEADQLSPDSQSVYGDFKRYLEYRGRGIPRRIIRALNEHVQWNERPFLCFTRDDVRRIRFYAAAERVLQEHAARLFPDEPEEAAHTAYDKRRLGVYYLVDWVLRRGAHEFTAADVVKAARALSTKIALADESAADVVDELLAVLRESQYIERVEAGLAEARLGDIDARKDAMYRLALGTRAQVGANAENATSGAAADELFAGRYSRLELIASGGMGVVYKAFDRVQGRPVALKKLRSNLLSEPQAVERFKQEASFLSQLRHPNVIEYIDAGQSDDEYYIAMEYLDGADVSQILEAQAYLAPPDAVAIALAVSKALEFIHGRGVVRNDIKPGNILVTRTGRVIILDFGTAKSQQPGQDQTATNAGIVGTPYYVAPEQIRGERVDHRVDIYALGVVLYEMLTGVRPFTGESAFDTMMAHLDSAAVPPSSRVEVPEALDAIVLTAMARDPNERFQTSAEMSTALAGLKLGAANLAALATHAKDRRDRAEARDEIKTATAGHATLVSAGLRPSGGFQEAATPPLAPPPPAAPPAPVVQATPASAAYAVAAPAAPGEAALIAQNGVEARTRFSLPRSGKSATIGRASTNDIPLSSAKLSRVQARIDCDSTGHFTIVDLNSLNGTQVNGVAARQPISLSQGDTIVVGDVSLVVDLGLETSRS